MKTVNKGDEPMRAHYFTRQPSQCYILYSGFVVYKQKHITPVNNEDPYALNCFDTLLYNRMLVTCPAKGINYVFEFYCLRATSVVGREHLVP